MVPCEVPEVTLDQLDLVSRPQNHTLPASCQEVPEPGMQAAVNTITFQLQQEPLVRNTVECLGQVKENLVSWARQITWFSQVIQR